MYIMNLKRESFGLSFFFGDGFNDQLGEMDESAKVKYPQSLLALLPVSFHCYEGAALLA